MRTGLLISAVLLLIATGFMLAASCGGSSGFGGPGTCYSTAMCSTVSYTGTNCTSCLSDQMGKGWQLPGGDCITSTDKCP